MISIGYPNILSQIGIGDKFKHLRADQLVIAIDENYYGLLLLTVVMNSIFDIICRIFSYLVLNESSPVVQHRVIFLHI